MKKSKINLLVRRDNYRRLESVFLWVRRGTLAFGVVVVVITIIFTMISLSQSTQLRDLIDRKNTLLEQLTQQKNKQAKLVYIQDKYQQIQTYLQDDSHSFPYYNLLNEALLKSTGSATLTSFVIQKNRNTTFTVSFSNFDELVNFFRFIESDNFLKNFEQVSLKSFNAVNRGTQPSYELSFSGTFIKINDVQN